jgi:hypothetical protein
MKLTNTRLTRIGFAVACLGCLTAGLRAQTTTPATTTTTTTTTTTVLEPNTCLGDLNNQFLGGILINGDNNLNAAQQSVKIHLVVPPGEAVP